MRHIILSLFLITCFHFGVFAGTTQDTIDNPYWMKMMSSRTTNYYQTVRAFKLYYSNKPKLPNSGWKQFERWAENAKLFIDEKGNFVPNDDILRAFKKIKSRMLSTRSSTGTWMSLGPKSSPPSTYGVPIGTGRVNGIGFHPTDPNTIYAGAPQGGFWKSTSKGAFWTSSTDNMPTLGVSDIAVIPSTPNAVILIGTGDRDANDAIGLGVYKSTDGGNSFSAANAAPMNNVSVNKLLVNPLRNGTIVAATDFGIFISYDTATTWVKKTIAGTSNYIDIKYCPNDTNTIYATDYTGSSSACSFYRTTNNFTSWASVSTGLTGGATRNRIAIAVTAHNPNIVYLVASRYTGNTNTNSSLEALYKSSNKGASFVAKLTTTPNILGSKTDGTSGRGQGWYDLAIESSPTDSNIVYVGGVNIFKSTDGGSNFTAVSDWTGATFDWVHADCHFLGRNPLNNELYIGTDGGVDYTTNEGNSYVHIDSGLAIGQFYNLGVSQRSKTKFIIGAQDNGTQLGSSVSTWSARLGGDGMHCEISNFDTTLVFGCVQYGALKISTNSGTSWTDLETLISEYPGQWIVPYHLHPRLNNILIAIYNNAWISKNINSGSPTFDTITDNITTAGSALRFSNINDSLVFMGWSNGTVKYCNNIFAANPTITNCSGSFPASVGATDIFDIETSYKNPDVLWVAKGNRIYRSADRGASWTNITSNLMVGPYNFPIKSIVVDKNMAEALYIGTAAGVFYKDSAMTNWILYNSGLPNISTITDLEIVYDTTCSSNSVIYASTYGRGLWKGDLRIDQTQPIPNFTIAATSCSGIPVAVTNTSTNAGAGTSYQWIVNPSAGVTFVNSTTSTSANPFMQFTTNGTYSITLIATKTSGGFCRTTKTNIITVGTGGSITLKTTNDTSICPGDTVLVKVLGMTNYTFVPNTFNTKVNDSMFFVYPPMPVNYMIIGDISGGCFDTTFVNVKMLASPTPLISGNQKFCIGDSTNITVTGVSDTVIWNPMTFVTFNAGPSNVKIKPTGPGQYNYTIIVKKAGLCDYKYVLPITVQSIANYVLNYPTRRDSICLGQSVTLIESGVASNTWAPGFGLNKVTGDTVIATPTSTTKYFVSTSDTTVCPNSFDTMTIIVKNPPTITILGGNDICKKDSSMMVAIGASITSYVWYPAGSLKKVSTDTFYFIDTVPGTYTVTVIGTNGTLCADTAYKTITVGSGSVNLTYSGDTFVCRNTAALIQAKGASSFRWRPDSLVNNVYDSIVQVYVKDSLTLQVTGVSSGCSKTISIPIKVKENPIIKIGSDTNTSVCEGTKVKLTATGATGYDIFPKYNYTKLSASVFEVKPLRTQYYYIYGTSSQGCKGVDSFEVRINTLPVLKITPQVKTIDKGDSIIFVASGATAYTWRPNKYVRPDGDTGKNVLIVKPDTNSIYYLTAKTSAGCQSEGLVIVYVKKGSSNGNNSISGTQIENILIYPNPSHNYVIISTPSNLSITTIDINGRVINNFIKMTEDYKIDLSAYPSGNYLLLLEDPNGNKNTVKLIVEK